jgi:hypothetical protein
MLIPHTAPSALERTAPLPRAAAVRYARRVQAARRWGRGVLSPATLEAPAIKSSALVVPHALRLTPEAAGNLTGLLKEVYERGWINRSVVSSMIGNDPAAIHAAILDAINAHLQQVTAPVQAHVGSTPVHPSFSLLCPPITHAIASAMPGESLVLDIIRTPVQSFPDLPEADTRALMFAWNKLAKASPFMCLVQHTAEAYTTWETEQLRDAASNGHWRGDVFEIDPSKVADHADERGQTPEQFADDAETFVMGERTIEKMLRAPRPKDAELRPDVLAVVRTLRALTRIVASLPRVPTIEEGPYAPLALAPPQGIHADLIDQGLDAFGQEIDSVRFHVENAGQLLDHYVNVSLHLSVAHAAFAKVLALHDPAHAPH